MEQWQPACDLIYLPLRAQLLSLIRDFFKQRLVLEVETPLMCQATGTDPQLDFFSSAYHCLPENKIMYLQTSPEFAMKRLLAAGSGSIFQICKAFRNGELGRLHNPEFSMLEWYRLEFDMHQLMDEVTELLTQILSKFYHFDSHLKISYSELFEQVTGLNPLFFCRQTYQQYATENAIHEAIEICGNDHSMWLDFIFSHKVQATLTNYTLCIVYGYPAIQSSLARINTENPAIADRFEVFVKGIELGNGFFELSDAHEQEKRFDVENKYRHTKKKPSVEKDQRFLAALRFGLPDCSGVALGLDRLLMLVSNNHSLNDILAFPFDRA